MERTNTGANASNTNQTLIGMVSLGCPKNLADGESMLGLLTARGYKITPDADLADIIIVNTCGFIDAAKKESIDAILEMGEKKVVGRCSALIVTGCLSERYRDLFASELPEADAVLGTGEYGRICDVVDYFAARIENNRVGENRNVPDSQRFGIINGDARTVRESTAFERIGHLNAPRVLTGGAGCVYIKIAEGCDNNCAYCVIPSLRGSYISRPPADIIAEARRLSAEREIEAVLVAQDTTYYGAADGIAGTVNLCGLLEELARLERVRWIRLMYAYPDRIDDLLAEQFVKNKKLLRYLDMPIQHASDGVLRGMGRRYRRVDLIALIDKLRRAAPGIVLRTTVMTGFPGESEDDFSALMDFISEAKFERLGVFAYSKEEGTRAALMSGQVPKKTALGRRTALLRAQSAVMSAAEEARIGLEYEAIIEKESRTTGKYGPVYEARTYAEAPDIDGIIRVSAKKRNANARDIILPGTFTTIKITGRDSKGLLGEIIR